MKPEDEKTEIEKLEEQIIELKSKIKNTEYDLEHMFKGNALVQQKLINAKKSLEEKQKLFDGLSRAAGSKKPEIAELPEKESEELFKDAEDSKEPVISKDQQEELDLEIEKEFM